MESASEVDMELEALRAIYQDDMKETGTSPISLDITLWPSPDPSENQVGIILSVKLPPEYPSTPPVLDGKVLKGLSDEQLREFVKKLEEQAQGLVGTAMIFTLATAAKEWLDEVQLAMRAEDEARLRAAKQAQAQEEERRRGTPVTASTFREWWERFRREREREASSSPLAAASSLRPTGRALFEADASLNTSDLSLANPDVDEPEPAASPVPKQA